MDDCADWDIGECHRIAGFHVGLRRWNHSSPAAKRCARDDVGEFAVGITISAMKDVRLGSYSIRLHFGRISSLRRFEVDDPVTLACGRRRETARNAAIVITPAARRLPLGQLLERLPLIKTRAINDDELAKTRRDRFELISMPLARSSH